MTNTQKNTFISFIIAIVLGLAFSEYVGQIYVEISKVNPGSLFVANPGPVLDGFAFVYCFVLSLLVPLFNNLKNMIKIVLLGTIPFTLLLIGEWVYFIAIILTIIIAALLGLAIKKLHSLYYLKLKK